MGLQIFCQYYQIVKSYRRAAFVLITFLSAGGLNACVSSVKGTGAGVARGDRNVDQVGEPLDTPLKQESGDAVNSRRIFVEDALPKKENALVAGPITTEFSAKFKHLRAFEGDLVIGNGQLQIVLAGAELNSSRLGWHRFIKAMFVNRDTATSTLQKQSQWSRIRDLSANGLFQINAPDRHLEIDSLDFFVQQDSASAEGPVEQRAIVALGFQTFDLSKQPAPTKQVLKISVPSTGSRFLIEVEATSPIPLVLKLPGDDRNWFAIQDRDTSGKISTRSQQYLINKPLVFDRDFPEEPLVIRSSKGTLNWQKHVPHTLVAVGMGQPLQIFVGNSVAMFPHVLLPGEGHQAIRFVAGAQEAPTIPLRWELIASDGTLVSAGIWDRKDQPLFTLPSSWPIRGWRVRIEGDREREIELTSAGVMPSRLGSLAAVLPMPQTPVSAVEFRLEGPGGKTRPAILKVRPKLASGSGVTSEMMPGPVMMPAISNDGSRYYVVSQESIVVRKWPMRLFLPPGEYQVAFSLGQHGAFCVKEFSVSQKSVATTTKSQISATVVSCDASSSFFRRLSPAGALINLLPRFSGAPVLEPKLWDLLSWTDGSIQPSYLLLDHRKGWLLAGFVAADITEAPILESGHLQDLARRFREQHPDGFLVLGCPRPGASEKTIREAIALTQVDAISAVGCASDDVSDEQIAGISDALRAGRKSPLSIFPAIIAAEQSAAVVDGLFPVVEVQQSKQSLSRQKIIDDFKRGAIVALYGGGIRSVVQKGENARQFVIRWAFNRHIQPKSVNLIFGPGRKYATPIENNLQTTYSPVADRQGSGFDLLEGETTVEIPEKSTAQPIRVELVGVGQTGKTVLVATSNTFLRNEPVSSNGGQSN